MKSIKTLLLGVAMIFSGVFLNSCDKTDLGKPVEPKLDIQQEVVVQAAGGKVEIPLVSSYPWYASTNTEWIKMIKFRGQMKLPEKIIIEVQPNTTGEVRQARLQIRLMDQLAVDIIIRQNAD